MPEIAGGAREAGMSLGVEEEFLLAGAEPGRCVPVAERVLDRAGAHRWRESGGGFHAELPATQVEAATGVCGDLPGLWEQVRYGRARLASAARAEGARLVATGTPVLGGRPPPITRGARFEAISAAYGDVVADYQACGCHVHVGVPDRETAVAVVNHLRPWLATLLALSVNSPFDRGRLTGYPGWRMVQIVRFPGAGVPPFAASAAEHEGRVAALVEAGVLTDEAMTFWLARPSPRWPTVEVRVADAAPTADEAVLHAALVRGLVRAALADLAAGREAEDLDGQVCAAALWNAARHGMDGPGLDPFTRRAVPAWRLLDDLLDRVRPALADLHDLDAVTALVEGVRRAGTGADRQRRAAGEGGAGAVVDMLAAQTESGGLPTATADEPGWPGGQGRKRAYGTRVSGYRTSDDPEVTEET